MGYKVSSPFPAALAGVPAPTGAFSFSYRIFSYPRLPVKPLPERFRRNPCAAADTRNGEAVKPHPPVNRRAADASCQRRLRRRESQLFDYSH